MKAVVLKAYGDVDQLSYEEVERPQPQAGEVLVKIAAASVNPIDWKIRSGAMREIMRIPLPTVLGYDLAGEVVELGAGVTSFAIGQKVLAIADHCYAEYAVVKAEVLAPMPEGLSFEQAAALSLVSITGTQLVESGIKPTSGQSVLLTGALGGVGRSAAYAATKLGAKVIVAVRSGQVAEAKLLGTSAVVSLEDDAGLANFSNLDGFADTVGGPVAAKLLKLLRPGGIYATVVGPPNEVKDYDIRVEMVFSHPDASRLAELAEDVVRGRLKLPVARVFKLSEVAEAQKLAQSGAGGKVVLIP
jgi:NADPH:quinone reductase-like Zn-dependent oxidoreductase